MTAPAGNDNGGADNGGADNGGAGGAGNLGNDNNSGADNFTPITSQSDFDARFNQRWSREQAKTAEQYKGYDDFKAKAAELDKLQAANQTESQRLQAERDEALKTAADNESRAVTAEKAALRQRIAIEEGLAPKFASRLTGDTEDELRADAQDTFGEFINKQSFDHGARNQSAPQSMNDLFFGAAKSR